MLDYVQKFKENVNWRNLTEREVYHMFISGIIGCLISLLATAIVNAVLVEISISFIFSTVANVLNR